jgi:subtilisin family serine protease
MNRNLLFLGMASVLSVLVLSCSESMTDLNPQASQNSSQSNLSQPSSLSKTIVPDDAYIVVYKDKTSDKELDVDVEDMDKSEGVKADHVYKSALKGFAARLTPKALAKLQKNPKVAYIEKDQEMSINATQNPTPSWGIDRIDQEGLPLANGFTYNNTGSNVDAYIIDTGILLTHTDFGGRAKGGYSAIGGRTNWTDQNGHGTHVAGTVGGTQYGVAKNVNLIAVRVLGANGSGTNSGVIAGIDWAINHHTNRPAVANMSLGGGISTTLDAAVERAILDGIVMCVAAGNSTIDAINSSPARVSNAITVGASGILDEKASYSNYGSIVDIFAPGTNITSAWIGSKTANKTISGTSMATPHVAGVAALYKSVNKDANTSTVQSALIQASMKGIITGLPMGTSNNLLFYPQY